MAGRRPSGPEERDLPPLGPTGHPAPGPARSAASSVSIFGAICPQEGKGAALVLPRCDTQAMSLHLAEVAQAVAPGAHGVLLMDRAGWHRAKDLVVPDHLTLVLLPARAPELNPVENIGNSCARTGCRAACSPPTVTSSITAATRGTASSTSLGSSCPSASGTGPMHPMHDDQRGLVLSRPSAANAPAPPEGLAGRDGAGAGVRHQTITRLRASGLVTSFGSRMNRHLVVLERQVVRDRPLLLPGKRLIELVVLRQRPVQILVAARLRREAPVVVLHERRQERVASLNVEMPDSRISFTSRSCNVPLARSTRPFAWGAFAQMMSMLSWSSARPNWVIPSPPAA